ncbi:MAG: protein kinase [Planctomycetota bacterium]
MSRSAALDDGKHGAPESDLVGTWIHDRYEVLEELGWGSLGHVYLARDHRLAPGHLVALKVIRLDRLTEASTAYLKHEFRALSALDHPHVAQVYDLDVVPGRDALFFSLELLRGETLVAAVHREGWRAGVELFAQTLRALAYVHDRGLIHMDLKPQNVLVLPEATGPKVKLLDFHLAQATDADQDRNLRGTVAYMSPEVIQGAPVDPRADLYSFGAVAYEALCKHPPFAHAPDVMHMLRAHASEPAPSFAFWGVDAVPPELEAVIQRLLEKDPAERYPTARATLRALNEALGLDLAPETPETRRSALRGGRFVGRDEALRLAETRLGPLRAGGQPDDGPWILLVRGEPGVGKSRFLAELRVSGQLAGVPFLAARPEVDDAHSGPFRRALGELLRRAGRGAELARHDEGGALDLEAWAREHGDAELPPRVRTTAASCALLSELAAAGPCALALDDLHRADEGTWELVRALAAGPALPFLLVVGVDPAHGEDLLDSPHVLDLSLGNLSAGATRELVGSLLAAEPPEPLVERLWGISGGNPRFVEDALRALAETGAVKSAEGRVTLREDWDRGLPATSLEGLCRERVERLGPDAARLLGALSVTPGPCGVPFASLVADLPPPRAEPALVDLKRRGLVEALPGPQPRVSVEHPPLRDATQAVLGAEVVRGLFARAAQLVESRHPVAGDAGSESDRAETLCHYYAGAGQPARAYAQACQAGQAAAARGEWRRACARFVQARELDPDAFAADPRARATCAEALAATGRRSLGLALLAPEPAEPEVLRIRARLLKDAGLFYAAEKAIERAVSASAALERARALAERASVRLWRANYQGAREDGEAAHAALSEARAWSEVVQVCESLYHATHFLGQSATATRWLRDGLEVSGRLAGQTGERLHPAALSETEQALLGDASGPWVTRSILEAGFERADRPAELREHYLRRAGLLDAAGDPEGVAFTRANLAHLDRACGHYAAALEGYALARYGFDQLESQIGAVLTRLNEAALWREVGDAERALAEALDVRERARSLGAGWVELQALETAVLAAREPNPAQALELLVEAQAISVAIGNVPHQAECLLLEAELAASEAQASPAALAALERFDALETGVKSVLQEARAELTRAELLLLEPDPKAAVRAEGAAGRALERAERRTMRELAWRAAWARARARRAQEDADGELEDLLAAMHVLRGIHDLLPPDLRATYFAHPARRAVRARFQEASQR